MPRSAPGSTIPDDFGYAKHPELRKWIEVTYSMLEPEKTMTHFIEWAEDAGRIATIWTACFKRIVRAGVENKWGGIVVYKEGRAADPKWASLLAEAKAQGFREPLPIEPTPQTYRQSLEQFISSKKRSNITPFPLPADAMKGF